MSFALFCASTEESQQTKQLRKFSTLPIWYPRRCYPQRIGSSLTPEGSPYTSARPRYSGTPRLQPTSIGLWTNMCRIKASSWHPVFQEPREALLKGFFALPGITDTSLAEIYP